MTMNRLRCPKCKSEKCSRQDITDAIEDFSYEDNYEDGVKNFGYVRKQYGECLSCEHQWTLRKHHTHNDNSKMGHYNDN